MNTDGMNARAEQGDESVHGNFPIERSISVAYHAF